MSYAVTSRPARAAAGAMAALLLCWLSGCEAPRTRLQEVKARGELRVLTRNTATTYYEGPQGPTGLEYDLTSGFADYLGVRLKLITPDKLSDILRMIEAGEADLAAAGLTVTEARKAVLRFGPVYQKISPQLVYRYGSRQPRNLDDLDGTLEVVAGSSHAERLRALQDEYPNLKFRENPEAGSEELLALVWERAIDYTVADSNEVAINRRFYPELRVAFDINGREPLAWAFPPGRDRSLIEAAERYFRKLRDSGRLEQLKERYYGHVVEFDYVGTRRYMRHIQTRLPRYRDLFEQAGRETGLDWRLLAAVGYQESHWNPKAVSPTGVRGIMMLTQATMKQLGIRKSRHDPASSILGGARYIARVKRKIPERIPEPDRTWMTLAAYNVGFGHLEDARILAQADGADPDKWVDVKKYLPLLSKKKWYRKTRHGYARGWEPVRYVENIRSYYDILVWITERERPQQQAPAPPAEKTPAS